MGVIEPEALDCRFYPARQAAKTSSAARKTPAPPRAPNTDSSLLVADARILGQFAGRAGVGLEDEAEDLRFRVGAGLELYDDVIAFAGRQRRFGDKRVGFLLELQLRFAARRFRSDGD